MNKLTKLLVVPFLLLTSCNYSTNNSNSANYVPIEVEEATLRPLLQQDVEVILFIVLNFWRIFRNLDFYP